MCSYVRAVALVHGQVRCDWTESSYSNRSKRGAPCHAMLCSAVLEVLCCAVLYCGVLCYTVLYCAVPVLYCTVLCLRCGVLYCTVERCGLVLRRYK